MNVKALDINQTLIKAGTLFVLKALLLGLLVFPYDAAAAGESPGCYESSGVGYFFDSVTWYILVDSGDGTLSWWTWDQYQAQTGAVAPQDLQAVGCWAELQYPWQGYTLFLDQGSIWYIHTDIGWITVTQYLELQGAGSASSDGNSTTWEMGWMDPNAWIGNILSDPWTRPNCYDTWHYYYGGGC